MEKPEIGTQNPSLETPLFSFLPHRRSHLKSKTYRTLVCILSHCYGQSQVSLATPVAPQELIRPDNGNNELEQATEKEMCEPGQFIGPCSTDHEDLQPQEATVIDKGLEATGFEEKETQKAIGEIELVMQMEENEDISKQKDSMVDDGTGLQDGGFGRKQMLMDEFELIMKGNEELVQDNSINLLATLLAENQSGAGVVASSLNNEDQQCDLQEIVMEEPGSETQLQVDKEQHSQQIHEAFDLSLDKSMTSEFSKPTENNEEKNSFLKTNSLEGKHEMHQKEMECEKPVSTGVILPSNNYMIEDGDIEEGEISGDFEIDDEIIGMLSGDAVSLEEKVDEKQVSEDIIDKREFPCNEENGATRKGSESTSFSVDANSGVEMELEQSATNRMVSKSEIVVRCITAKGADRHDSMPAAGEKKRKRSGADGIGYQVACPNNFVLHGENVEQSASEDQGISSKEKSDAGVYQKKKRGTPSKENKAKKKQSGRKKRAEKNRQLGVKRLKLRPVVKPKPVTYCRHYLMGRCHEGDKCKFSHDTIPLTKSKPCCHFARHSCMKGDDCPFDHQLSKYPCTNYVTEGFCCRGDDCMFSHKVPLKEDAPSASDACKPEADPPSLMGISHSQKQVNISGPSHQNVDVSSHSVGVLSCKSTEQNVIETLLKRPVLQTKSFSSPSVGKSLVQSSKPNQGNSSAKINESGKVGHQTNQSASDTVQNVNKIPIRTPLAVRPKGLNFLSFGLNQTKQSASHTIKLSLSKYFNLHEQASSSSSGDDSVKLGSQTTESVPSTSGNCNEMLKNTQPVVAPKGMSFLSFGRDLIDHSRSDKQASLPSSLDNRISRYVLEDGNASDKHKNPSAMQQKLPASALTSGQYLDQLGSGHCENMLNSTRKTLMSTLTFAAKFESEVKINRSANSSVAVNNKGAKNSSVHGGSKNDPSKILEFLSSFRSKTKQ